MAKAIIMAAAFGTAESRAPSKPTVTVKAPYRDSALEVGFQEPQVLIGCSRNLGEQIRGGFVAKLVGFVDGSARRIGKSGKPLHQRFYVLLALYRIEIYSLMEESAAAWRAVPLATPPSWVTRSAIRSD